MKKALEQMQKDAEEIKAACEKMKQEHAQINADHKQFGDMTTAATAPAPSAKK